MKKKDKVQIMSMALAACLTLSACSSSREISSDKSNMDVLDSNQIENPNIDEDFDEGLNRGVTQKLDVNGEEFKLVVNYLCEDGADWRITDTKSLYTTIKTEGLKEGIEVYIDNIHADTSIVSTKALYNGILQDTMDDRIHNSLMLGFPISDTSSYFGCNVIEGQNSEFIEGWSHGYNGYHSGEIETKRRLESDFLEEGVYANQIDSVIDLIIIDNNTGITRTVSVSSKLLVKVNNRITCLETSMSGKSSYVTYEYDIYGKKTEISSLDESSYKLVLGK